MRALPLARGIFWLMTRVCLEEEIQERPKAERVAFRFGWVWGEGLVELRKCLGGSADLWGIKFYQAIAEGKAGAWMLYT